MTALKMQIEFMALQLPEYKKKHDILETQEKQMINLIEDDKNASVLVGLQSMIAIQKQVLLDLLCLRNQGGIHKDKKAIESLSNRLAELGIEKDALDELLRDLTREDMNKDEIVQLKETIKITMEQVDTLRESAEVYERDLIQEKDSKENIKLMCRKLEEEAQSTHGNWVAKLVALEKQFSAYRESKELQIQGQQELQRQLYNEINRTKESLRADLDLRKVTSHQLSCAEFIIVLIALGI